MEKVLPVLVLGIGNILQRDDGVGVHAVRMLEGEDDIPGKVEILDGATGGLDLIPVMENREVVIIIDALRVEDEPGTLYRLGPEEAQHRGVGFSLHDFGIMQALQMLNVSGHNPRVEIIGIVPGDIASISMDLSPKVRDSLVDVVSLVKTILKEIGIYD